MSHPVDLAQSLIQCRIGHIKTPRQFKTFEKINLGHEILLEKPGFEPLPKLLYSKLLSKSRRVFCIDSTACRSCHQCMGVRTEVYFHIEWVPTWLNFAENL